jgi:WD40 repeat protein
VVTASGDLDTSDHSARVWEVTNGREVARLLGHEDRVFSAEFSPDGTKVLTASWDGTARLWDISTKAEIRSYRHDGRVNSGTFSANGGLILTASSDRTASIWETTTGKELTRLIGHDGPINLAEFSPDGRKIVTASSDQTIRLWEVTTGKEVAKLIGHDDPVNSAMFSRNGHMIVTASSDGTARLWETKWLTDYRGQELTLRVCGEKLVGARRLTRKEVELSSLLSTQEGEDVCDPSSVLSSIAEWFRPLSHDSK